MMLAIAEVPWPVVAIAALAAAVVVWWLIAAHRSDHRA